MKKNKIRYDILESIIGLDYKSAYDICQFNGYKLGGDVKFWSIKYEIFNDRIAFTKYVI
jgi:hypothetical protein